MMRNFSSPEAAHLLLSVDIHFLTRNSLSPCNPFFFSGINSIFFSVVFKVRSQAAGLRRSVQAYPEEEGQDHQEAGPQVHLLSKFFSVFSCLCCHAICTSIDLVGWIRILLGKNTHKNRKSKVSNIQSLFIKSLDPKWVIDLNPTMLDLGPR
jgi:hypothetical protein